jgi:hypothetical protein
MKGDIDIGVFDGYRWNFRILTEVRYVPNFGSANLFSIGVITSKGYLAVYKRRTSKKWMDMKSPWLTKA